MLMFSLFLLWCVCLRDLVVHVNHLVYQSTQVQIRRMLPHRVEVLQTDSCRQLQIVVCQKPTASKKVLVKSD
jgi:sortase (surface protein transpeptidase)